MAIATKLRPHSIQDSRELYVYDHSSGLDNEALEHALDQDKDRSGWLPGFELKCIPDEGDTNE